MYASETGTHVCVCVCVCVCVWSIRCSECVQLGMAPCVCVCVCVCGQLRCTYLCKWMWHHECVCGGQLCTSMCAYGHHMAGFNVRNVDI